MLTKPLFLGLVPAGVLALAIAAWRLAETRRARLTLLAAGLGAAVVPVMAYDLLGSLVFDHAYFPDGVAVAAVAAGGVGGPARPTGFAGLRAEASYIWQLFLPRLPFMVDRFPGPAPLRVTWFDGFVGRFGWLDYAFAKSVTDWAVRIAFAVLALAAVGLARARRSLRRRWAGLLLAVAGVLGAIGVQQYNAFFNNTPALTQTRYLLPLLALYGGLAAIVARALDRRAAPFVGVALVALAALHAVAAMMLTVTASTPEPRASSPG